MTCKELFGLTMIVTVTALGMYDITKDARAAVLGLLGAVAGYLSGAKLDSPAKKLV
jgi:hypothetical protein